VYVRRTHVIASASHNDAIALSMHLWYVIVVVPSSLLE